jgi:hypothetical protein
MSNTVPDPSRHESTPTFDAGFYALDRTAVRRVIAMYGEHAAYLLVLASECRHTDPDRVPTGTVADLAEILGLSYHRTRTVLAALEAVGAIEWERATNQHTGSLRLLVNLEHASARRRKPTSAATRPAPQPKHRTVVRAESAPDRLVSREQHTPVAVLEPDEPGIGEPIPTDPGPMDNRPPVTVGVPKSATPNTRIPITKKKENPPYPPTGSPSGTDGGGIIPHQEHDEALQDTLRAAAELVCEARAHRMGPAGPAAIRRVAATIAERFEATATEWLAAEHDRIRIAQALAERFRASTGEGGNAGAVPYTLDHRTMLARIETCDRGCDDGYRYYDQHGAPVAAEYGQATELCECRKANA